MTPLVCLAAGAALGRLIAGRGFGRWLARGLLGLLLIVQGLVLQWQVVAAGLHNALQPRLLHDP